MAGKLLSATVSERDHAQGSPDAPLTLLQYGDYECPYCGRAYPVVKQLQQRLGNRLRFVFRNFPMNNVHAHASVAAQAAEAAAAQGKFRPMHDLLYAHQHDLADIDLQQLAIRVGLELYKFNADLAGGRHARRVQEDLASGRASGVTETPTFFINARRYEGPHDFDSMLAALEEAEKAGNIDGTDEDR
jgi:protein-disulfide isomerase